MSGRLSSFDVERYMRQKLLEIMTQNGGIKLTTETLSELERKGLKLIPPLPSY